VSAFADGPIHPDNLCPAVHTRGLKSVLITLNKVCKLPAGQLQKREFCCTVAVAVSTFGA
jgi:hypothetical protein